MTDRELLEQALEALENPWKAGPDGVANAITALRERLAQPERKPVAWLPSDPPPECTSEAEKTAFAFGWFKAMEAQRVAQPEQEPVSLNDGRLTLYADGRIGLGTPQQPEQEHIIDCPRCGHCCSQQPVQERPQNCGTGYCSCVECLFEPEQPEQDQKPLVKSYCGGKPNYCTPEQEAKMLLIDEGTAELVLEALENVTKDYVENRKRTHDRAIDQLYKVFTQKLQRREWQGLTLDEKKRLNDALNLQGRFPVIDAIETKLKEKNT